MGNGGLKTCGDCKREQIVANFYKVQRNPDGLHRYCKACCKVHRAQERVKKRDKKKGISNRQRYRATVEHGHDDAETILLSDVYRRDGGRCHICKKYVPSNLASLDHVIPLSRGGRHVIGNVKIAHLKCNKRKGAKV